VNDDTQIDQASTEKLPAGTLTSLAPLFTWRGRSVYSVFGAEGDDDTGGGSGGAPDDDDNDDDTGKSDDGNGSDTVSRDDYEKLRNQLRAADKNKSAAEKRLKDIEDSKKDEFTKATERVKELEEANAKQASELSEMRLQNAFLTANTGITWHDPADALALAERQGYLAEVVDEGGKVDGSKLTAKLKELAKAKPHLVKSGKEDSGSGEQKQTPTGSKVGTKGKGGKDEPDLSRYSRLLSR